MTRSRKEGETWFNRNSLKLCLLLATILSASSFLFFYSNGNSNIVYVDAWAHLNAGRKIFDNLTPGFAQLGGEWLPLLHVLLIPFVWNDFFWQSGIAGYLISGPAFIVSVYFIYRTIELLSLDHKSAFLGSLVYMTSVNMLYLQTMPMMESLFNLTIIGSVYFIVKWAKNGSIPNLIVGGLFVSASTLTRYEGYGVFVFAFLAVFVISLFKNRRQKKPKKTEGSALLFVTIASLGIFLWSVYLGLVFGNPLHWLNPNQEIQSIATVQTETNNSIDSKYNSNLAVSNDIEGARKEYFHKAGKTLTILWSATALANGVVLVTFSTIGFLMFALTHLRKFSVEHSFSISVLLIPSAVFIFLFITMYFDKTVMSSPVLSWSNLLDRDLNYLHEKGIRYTMPFLLFVSIFIGYLATGKWYKKVFVLVAIIFQIVTVFVGPLFLTYNFYPKWQKMYAERPASIEWFKNHYDGGLVLVSTLIHEPKMHQYNIPYKYFLHEGTNQYWNESLENPAKFASWVIMNKDVNNTGGMGGSDVLTRVFYQNTDLFNESFDLVCDDNSVRIYKIKDKPEVDLLEELGKK